MIFSKFSIRLFFTVCIVICFKIANAAALTTIEHEVNEPIFKGTALIYENGDNKNKSVVLVHGLGTIGAQDWSKFIPVLAEKYHVISFDLPGFARSSKGNHNYSPENYANFVNWVVTQYVKDDYVLVGHSMGGAIALYYAAYYPRQIEQLILVDAAGILHRVSFTKYAFENFKPTSWWPDLSFDQINRFLPVKIETLERFPMAFDLVVNTAFARKGLLGSDPLKIAGMSLVLQDYSQVIQRINTPTQIIWGEKDPIAPVRTGELLKVRLANARLHIIKDVGHNPMQSKPKEFNQLALRIINAGPLPKSKQDSKRTESGWFSFAETDREENCKSESNKVLTGKYKKIILEDCHNIKLNNVSTDYLELTNSNANMTDGEIVGNDIALKMLNSVFTATAVDITGDTAILVTESKLDLAGTNIVAKKQAIQSKGNGVSTILFSVSHISSSHYSGFVHELLQTSVKKPSRF